MKTIVTGGCGFIGSHATDRLVNDGREVIIIDNLSSGSPVNIDHHKGNPNVQFYKADIADYDSIQHLFKDVNCVYHLAALADIVPSIEKPMAYHSSNVDGTISVLESCRRHNVPR